MLDSIKLLTNVASANIFDTVLTRYLYAGCSPVPFYIRLWQSESDARYIPVGSVITVTVEFLRMSTVGETPTSQTVVKTLTQPYPTLDASIWGVDLVAADIANITTGGFRITVTEDATITKIYSKMTIRKIPGSDWPLVDEPATPLVPTAPIDALWEKIGDILYPVYPTDQVNANRINVNGTYVNIPGTPDDLESTIASLDAVIGTSLVPTWDRDVFTATLSPHVAGDDVDLGTGDFFAHDCTLTGVLVGGSSPFVIQSKEADGGTAVAFVLDSLYALTNPAALLFSLRNHLVEKFAIDKDGNITTVGTVDGIDISAISLSNMPAAAAGNIDCGAQSITNVNLVDGVDVSALPGTIAGKLDASAFTDAAVTGKLITGFVSGAGAVVATDTILQAINKLDGNVALKVAKAGDTMSGDLTMANQKGIYFKELTANGANSIKLQAPALLGGDYVLTLPADDGTAGQYLQTNGSGVMSWQTVTIPAQYWQRVGTLLSPTTAGDSVQVDGTLTAAVVYTDTINEQTLNAGVTIEGVLFTDYDMTVNNIRMEGDELSMINTNEGVLMLSGDYCYDDSTTLANSLKTIMNAHAADGAEHMHGGVPSPDTAYFPVTESAASDWDSLIALTNALTWAYSSHAHDGASVGGGTYHNAQTPFTYQLNSAAYVYTMYDIAKRLNDIKLKYNQHEADATGHTVGSAHTEINSDAPTYGFRSDTTGSWMNFMGLFFSPEDDSVSSLGYYSNSWKEIWLNNDATDGGTVHFNGSFAGSSYIQSSADGKLLSLAGFDNAALMFDSYCDGDVFASPGSAIVLANSLKYNLNNHFVSRYGAHSDNDFVSTITEADATHSLADLIALIVDLMAGYTNHDTDATLGAGSLYHKNSAYAGNPLASLIAPINLVECLARLADIKAKYNLHEGDGTAHYATGLWTETHSAYSGDYSLGSINYPWKSLYFNNDATDGGAIYFDAGTSKFLKADAGGTILDVGGFGYLRPNSDASMRLGDISHNFASLYLDVGGISGGEIFFNNGGSFLQSSSDGLTLTSSKFTSILPRLDMALDLASNIKTFYNLHLADAVPPGTDLHTNADGVNVITSSSGWDLTSLIAFLTEALVDYAAHDLDATLGAGSAYHLNSAYAGNPLVSVVAPTNLEECVTKINDLRAKYLLHDASAVAHNTGSRYQVVSLAANYGEVSLGSTSQPYKEFVGTKVGLDNGVVDGGAIYFNSGTTSYLKASTDGLTLSVGGITSLDVLAADIILENQKGIYFKELAVNGVQSIKLQAPALLGGDYVLTLPVDDGTAGQYLQTDGSGVLSWQTVAVTQVWDRSGTLLIPHTAGDDVVLGTTAAVADITGDVSAVELKSKTMPVYNAQLWGMVGNGATDNTAAWAVLGAAVVAAGGGTIYFPAGTYLISTTTYDFNKTDGIKIIGDGRELTILDFSAANINGLYNMGNGSEVRDMTIKTKAAYYAIYISDSVNDDFPTTIVQNVFVNGGQTYFIVSHLWINGLHCDQIGGVSGYGLRCEGYWNIVQNVYVTGYTHGVYVNAANNSIFSGIKAISNTNNFNLPSLIRTIWTDIYSQFGGSRGIYLNGAASAYEGNTIRGVTTFEGFSGTTGMSGFDAIFNYSTDGTTWTTKIKDDYGTFAHRRLKVTKAYSAFSDPGLLKQVTLFTLPAGAAIRDVYAVINTTFRGGTIAAYTISVGVAATPTKYMLANDVYTATGNLFTAAAKGAELTVNPLDTHIESVTVGTAIVAEAISVGGVLNTATQGSIDIYIEYIEQVY